MTIAGGLGQRRRGMMDGYRILCLRRWQSGHRCRLWYGDRAHRLIKCIRAVLHQHRARVEQR